MRIPVHFHEGRALPPYPQTPTGTKETYGFSGLFPYLAEMQARWLVMLPHDEMLMYDEASFARLVLFLCSAKI